MISDQGLLYSIRDAQSRVKSLAEELILAGEIRNDLLKLARAREIPEEQIREYLDK